MHVFKAKNSTGTYKYCYAKDELLHCLKGGLGKIVLWKGRKVKLKLYKLTSLFFIGRGNVISWVIKWVICVIEYLRQLLIITQSRNDFFLWVVHSLPGWMHFTALSADVSAWEVYFYAMPVSGTRPLGLKFFLVFSRDKSWSVNT